MCGLNEKTINHVFLVTSVRNSSSMNQNFKLNILDKVKHYIKVKTRNIIVLKFYDKSSVKYLIYVKPISYV